MASFSLAHSSTTTSFPALQSSSVVSPRLRKAAMLSRIYCSLLSDMHDAWTRYRQSTTRPRRRGHEPQPVGTSSLPMQMQLNLHSLLVSSKLLGACAPQSTEAGRTVCDFVRIVLLRLLVRTVISRVRKKTSHPAYRFRQPVLVVKSSVTTSRACLRSRTGLKSFRYCCHLGPRNRNITDHPCRVFL